MAWLAAAIVVIAAAAAMATELGGWWVAAAIATVVSQAVILTSWRDAKWGTVANLMVLLAAGYGFVSIGPASFQAEWRERPVPWRFRRCVDDVHRQAAQHLRRLAAALPVPSEMGSQSEMG